MKSFALFLLIVASAYSQVCVRVSWSSVNVRSSPCGSIVASMTNGQQTTVRRGVTPVSCAVSGTTYTWVPVAHSTGWVASDALEACPSQCVSVDADSLNVRSAPCGSVATTLSRGNQKTLSSNALTASSCFGRIYLWVQTPQGWAVVDYLAPCPSSPPVNPPPGTGGCNSNTKPTRIGQNGLSLIKRWEGLRNCWYRDPVGLPTIGYGHLIRAGEPYKSGTCLSNQQCEDLLKSDLGSYESCVNSYIKVPLNPNQFDALVSFAFNLGCGALQGSNLRTRLNAGDYAGVCPEMKRWVHAGGKVLQGLVNRRNDECNLFESCAGFIPSGNYRDCPAADPCDACILNSQNEILQMYDDLGMNTSCTAANWAYLRTDWCTVVDPWGCYWKGPAAAINGTQPACPMCAPMAPPTIRGNPGAIGLANCVDNYGELCGITDCSVLVEGSTCDVQTGTCVSPVISGFSANVTQCIPTDIATEDSDAPKMMVVLYLLVALLLVVML